MNPNMLLFGAVMLMVHFGESLLHDNPYDAIKGCLLLDNVPDYDDVQKYLPTNQFHNLGRTANSTYMRVGVVGAKGAHIRYGKTQFPYDQTVVETVVGADNNERCFGRLQTRRQDNKPANVLLKNVYTPGILSASRPLVFRMEVFNDGRVQLTKDGETRPFFEFKNTQTTITVDYVAFTKFFSNVIYFYDCPL